jgi:hypothetical protein
MEALGGELLVRPLGDRRAAGRKKVEITKGILAFSLDDTYSLRCTTLSARSSARAGRSISYFALEAVVGGPPLVEICPRV